MYVDKLSRSIIVSRGGQPAVPEAQANCSTETDSIDWGPAFRFENFTQIPNGVFNLVLQERLIAFDLLTYSYFLSKAGAMEAMGKRDYTIVPEQQAAYDLKCCVRTIRASVARLVAEKLIERRDTPGNTHTRMLVKVEDTKVVQRPRKFPPRTMRNQTKQAVPPDSSVTAQLQPSTPQPEDEEMPF